MLTVRLYTDKVVTQKCEDVTEFDDNLKALAEDMVIAMHQYKGVGLAANQVGINKNVCVMWVENKTQILVLVNPKIVRSSKKKDTQPEGCLSCPGLNINVKRRKEVVVEAQLLTGEHVTIHFTDYDARIAQHEIDHLNGICIAHLVKSVIK